MPARVQAVRSMLLDHLGVDGIAHGRHHPGLVGQPLLQALDAEDDVGLVVVHLEMRPQVLEHLGEDFTGNEDLRFHRLT
jgi:hypothetical protein